MRQTKSHNFLKFFKQIILRKMLKLLLILLQNTYKLTCQWI